MMSTLKSASKRYRSPSARRAWIEILLLKPQKAWKTVALRTEGVDRNLNAPQMILFGLVALRTEGVDRNFGGVWLAEMATGRPPHGGRG